MSTPTGSLEKIYKGAPCLELYTPLWRKRPRARRLIARASAVDRTEVARLRLPAAGVEDG